jgi:TP901 family phage tail tape measure protein
MDFSTAKASGASLHGAGGSTRKLDFLVSVTNMTVPGLMAVESGFANLTAAGMRTSNLLNRELSLVGAGMMALGGVGVLALGLMTSAAVDFENSMKTVESLISSTSVSSQQMSQTMAEMSSNAKGLALAFGKSPNEIAEGMTVLARAGVTANDQIQQVMTSSLELSRIEGIDASEASKEVINLVNLFGNGDYTKYSESLTTVIAHAANISTTSAPDIMMGLQYAGGIANSMWGSADPVRNMTEMSAAIAALNQQGVSAAVAGNAVKSFANYMVKDMPKSQKALSQIGLSESDLRDESGNFKRLPDVLHMFQKQFEAQGMNEADIYQWFVKWGEPRQAQQYMKLISTNGQESVYDKMLDQMSEPYSLQEKTSKMMESASASFQKFEASLQVFAIGVGETVVPVLELLANGLTTVTGALNQIPGATQLASIGLLGMVGAGGMSLYKWARGRKDSNLVAGAMGMDPEMVEKQGQTIIGTNDKISKSQENLSKQQEKGQRQQENSRKEIDKGNKELQKQGGVISSVTASGRDYNMLIDTNIDRQDKLKQQVQRERLIGNPYSKNPIDHIFRTEQILNNPGGRPLMRSEEIIQALTGKGYSGLPERDILGSTNGRTYMNGWYGSDKEWIANYYGKAYGEPMFVGALGAGQAERKEIRDKIADENKKQMDEHRKTLDNTKKQTQIEKEGRQRGSGGVGRTSQIMKEMFGSYDGVSATPQYDRMMREARQNPTRMNQFLSSFGGLIGATNYEKLKNTTDDFRRDANQKTRDYRAFLGTQKERLKALPGRAGGTLTKLGTRAGKAGWGGLAALGGLVGLGPEVAAVALAGGVAAYGGYQYARSKGWGYTNEETITTGLEGEKNTLNGIKSASDELGKSIDNLKTKQKQYNEGSKEWVDLQKQIDQAQTSKTNLDNSSKALNDQYESDKKRNADLDAALRDTTHQDTENTQYAIWKANMTSKYGSRYLPDSYKVNDALNVKQKLVGYRDYVSDKNAALLKGVNDGTDPYAKFYNTKAGGVALQNRLGANSDRQRSYMTAYGYVKDSSGNWVKNTSGWALWDQFKGRWGYEIADPLNQWYWGNVPKWSTDKNGNPNGNEGFLNDPIGAILNPQSWLQGDPIKDGAKKQTNVPKANAASVKKVEVKKIVVESNMSDDRAKEIIKKAVYEMAEGK